jgi:hypothetical protein
MSAAIAAAVRRSWRALPFVALALLITASAMGAMSQHEKVQASPKLPQNVWGVEVGPKVLGLLDRKTLRQLRDAGFNTMFGRKGQLKPAQRKELVKIAKGWGFTLLWPQQYGNGHGAAATISAKCAGVKRTGAPCVVLTNGAGNAASLAKTANVDVVLVRVQNPTAAAAVANVAANNGRIVALANVAGSKFPVNAWVAAVRTAAGSTSFDLAVSPSGMTRKRGLSLVTELLRLMAPQVKQLTSAAANSAVSASGPSVQGGGAAKRPAGTTTTVKKTNGNGNGHGHPTTTQTTTTTTTTKTTTTTATTTTTTPTQTHPSTTTTTTTTTTPTTTTTTPKTTTTTTTTPTTTTTTPTTTTTTPTSDGNVYVSTSGSDSNACTGSAPCASFSKAYQVARPGQTVYVGSGSYPNQRIDYDSAKSSPAVVFAPAAGAFVSVARLDLGQAQLNARAPQHVVVRDMTIGYTAVWDGGSDITLQNLSGRGFDVISGGSGWPLPDNVRVLGGNFGPCEAVAQNGNCTNRMIGTNIVVDGVSIHDVTSNDLARFHVDGIFLRGCQGCAVRNSTFRTNDITNIRIQNCCGLPSNQNVVLENNSFGQPNGGRDDGIDIDTATPGLIIRNNVFDPNTGPNFDGSGYNGERLSQNKMKYLGWCVPNVSYESNLVKQFSTYTGNTLCGTDSWGNWSL